MERVVIFGAPGSGKSTLARRLAAQTGAPVIERDALGKLGSQTYRAAVASAVQEDRWIFDGAPYYVDDVVYSRADTVIVLDFAKTVVMRRVLARSLRLLVRRKPLGAHRPAGLRAWFGSDHPIRVAWAMYDARRKEAGKLPARKDLRPAHIMTFGTPRELRAWLDQP